MNKKLKISFVVGLHNPDYGKKYLMDNLYRTQLFIDNLVYLCNKYNLFSELIIVEWNPKNPGEFFQKIDWPRELGSIIIRWIEVPPDVHNKLPNSSKIPIFEFFAKNVGIRRAKGKYIISTNPDTLFSQPLIRYLSKTKLTKDNFYRIDRLDVSGCISRKMTIEERLNYCSAHIIKRHTLYGSIKPEKMIFPNPISLLLKKRKLAKQYWSGQGLVAYPDGLHRNASGDFFLMNKESWNRLHGYAQLNTYSHIDSIMCWQAATLNLKQIILKEKYKLYHIDHDRKSRQSEPVTNWVKWYKKFELYKKNKKALIVNDKNWGLAGKKLKETVINQYGLF